MDKKHLNDHISKIALETPDQPENVPFSGKKVTISLKIFALFIQLPDSYFRLQVKRKTLQQKWYSIPSLQCQRSRHILKK
jgi:hypothetical protein